MNHSTKYLHLGLSCPPRKRRVEETLAALDVSVLIGPRGIYEGKNINGVLSWKDGEVLLAFNLVRSIERGLLLKLAYQILLDDDSAVEKTEIIKFLTTRIHGGGLRYNFECPRCHRRVRCIYLVPGCTEFGCRVCLGLGYRSQQVKQNLVVPV